MSKAKRGLYIRTGDAEFRRLSKDQCNKIKKSVEIHGLVRQSLRAASALRGLIAWMEVVERRGYRMTGGDIHLIKLPNRDRLLSILHDLEGARRKL